MGHSSYNPGVSSIKDTDIDSEGDKEVEEVNLEVTHLKYAFKERQFPVEGQRAKGLLFHVPFWPLMA